jgi:hypothetical protein
MRSDASRRTAEADADGTEVEENRQLTKLLLENSVAYDPSAAKSSCGTIEPERTTILEVAILLALAPLFWIYSLVVSNSINEFDETY